MRRPLLAISLATILTASAAGCASSGGEAEPTTTTAAESDGSSTTTAVDDALVDFDDWQDEINEICVDLVAASQAIEQPEDFEELAEVSEEFGDVLADGFAELEAVGTPDDEAELAGDWLASVEAQIPLYADMAEAAGDEDQAAVEQLVDDLEELRDERREMSEELGLDECIDDDEEDGDEDVTSTGSDPTTDPTAGGPADPGTPEALRDYLTGACVGLDVAVSANEDQLGTDDDVAELDWLELFAEDWEEFTKAVNTADYPSEMREQRDDLTLLLLEYTALLGELIDLAESGADTPTEPLLEAMDDKGAEIEAAFEALGVTACSD